MPKLEPAESPLTDYSGDNTNDTDIALLDDVAEKKQNVRSFLGFRSQNGKNGTLIVSSCPSVRLSVCPSVTADLLGNYKYYSDEI